MRAWWSIPKLSPSEGKEDAFQRSVARGDSVHCMPACGEPGEHHRQSTRQVVNAHCKFAVGLLGAFHAWFARQHLDVNAALYFQIQRFRRGQQTVEPLQGVTRHYVAVVDDDHTIAK